MTEDRLRREVQRLKQWADRNDPDTYPHFREVYEAVRWHLERGQISSEQISLLLDALALDDEGETIQELLRESPDVTQSVICAALEYPDSRARWQTGVLAGETAPEDIVCSYLKDSYEYVRRRTLLSARSRYPALAESVAVSWLDSPYEYERMVALDTLHILGSSQYPDAASILARDPSSVVQKRLKQLGES